jgi:hypothetical protein
MFSRATVYSDRLVLHARDRANPRHAGYRAYLWLVAAHVATPMRWNRDKVSGSAFPPEIARTESSCPRFATDRCRRRRGSIRCLGLASLSRGLGALSSKYEAMFLAHPPSTIRPPDLTSMARCGSKCSSFCKSDRPPGKYGGTLYRGISRISALTTASAAISRPWPIRRQYRCIEPGAPIRHDPDNGHVEEIGRPWALRGHDGKPVPAEAGKR